VKMNAQPFEIVQENDSVINPEKPNPGGIGM
jgi:hypothetical protein